MQLINGLELAVLFVDVKRLDVGYVVVGLFAKPLRHVLLVVAPSTRNAPSQEERTDAEGGGEPAQVGDRVGTELGEDAGDELGEVLFLGLAVDGKRVGGGGAVDCPLS